MGYKETEKTIKEFENKYGDIVVRTAFTYMIDVGKEHFNDETVKEIKEDIIAECRAIEAKGNTPLATADFQCKIVDVAYELSKLPTFELLVYVQENMYINVGQETVSKNRLAKIANVALDYMYEEIAYNSKEFMDICNNYEIDEEELIALGWEDVINECYEGEKDKDITDD